MSCGPKYSTKEWGYCEVTSSTGGKYKIGWGEYTIKASQVADYKVMKSSFVASKIFALAKAALNFTDPAEMPITIYYVWWSKNTGKESSIPRTRRIDVLYDEAKRDAFFDSTYALAVKAAPKGGVVIDNALSMYTLSEGAKYSDVSIKSLLTTQAELALAKQIDSWRKRNVDPLVANAKKDIFLWGSVLVSAFGILAWQITRR